MAARDTVNVEEPGSIPARPTRLKSVHEVRRVLERITYKPLWKITVSQAHVSDEYLFCLAYKAPDAMRAYRDAENVHNPYTWTKIITTYATHPANVRTEEEVLETVKSLIRQAEVHEQNEWLKIDGKHVTDPHPEIRKVARMVREHGANVSGVKAL